MVCDIHFRMPWRPGVLQIQVSSLKFLFIFFIAFFDENNHQVKIGAFLLFDDLFWGVKTSGMKNNYEIIRFGRHRIQNTHTPYREIVSLSQNSKLSFFFIFVILIHWRKKFILFCMSFWQARLIAIYSVLVAKTKLSELHFSTNEFCT